MTLTSEHLASEHLIALDDGRAVADFFQDRELVHGRRRHTYICELSRRQEKAGIVKRKRTIVKNTNRAKFMAAALALALIASACGVFGYGAVDIVEIERTGPTEILLIANTCGSEPVAESWEVDGATRAIEVSVSRTQSGTTNECQEAVPQTLPDDGEWTITDTTSGTEFVVQAHVAEEES